MCMWCPHQLELSQQLVVLRHLSLSLVYLDLHLGLAISRCGEHLPSHTRHQH